MNKIDFNQPGGFPLETETLDFMQATYSLLLNKIGELAGDRSIISGCVTTGTSVSDGLVYVNGELLPFVGGFEQPNVIIVEDTELREFEDTELRTVFYKRYATFGTATVSYPWADFVECIPLNMVAPMLDSKVDTYDFTPLVTLVNAMKFKLDTIAYSAEENVQPDWNETDNTKDGFIKNKPALVSILYKGSYHIGDVLTADAYRTVTFPDVGTSSYMVLGTIISNSSNSADDNDVIVAVREKTNTSFKLTIRETATPIQDINYEYILIPI
ncbi:hypothetical protein [Flavobacterium gilvum]|uniref:Uncharacterized protein n=1 Tax=Flavobacterium gilvum TaxID=1492737 RepID=A0AAC9I3B8_9FLAO|nr:hypothetical protein [Flavobacterium gilvum]AOW09529.1 hypothetical protein EM308_08455 [Flavobacterium gilvum]KFC60037.1 hypothetical protein FEM08_12160 [Flavobacterium gilvum]